VLWYDEEEEEVYQLKRQLQPLEKLHSQFLLLITLHSIPIHMGSFDRDKTPSKDQQSDGTGEFTNSARTMAGIVKESLQSLFSSLPDSVRSSPPVASFFSSLLSLQI
jgi:hypothetical protein